MQMDYHLLHPALQYIKWIELHYIADGRTSSKETVDFIIGTDFEWNCVVTSLTVIVIILSLKTDSIGFLSVAIIINVIIIFLTWILLLSLKLTYIIVIIIIIIIVIIIDYYLSLLLSLSFFELIQMLCIAFLLNLEWSDWPPP